MARPHEPGRRGSSIGWYIGRPASVLPYSSTSCSPNRLLEIGGELVGHRHAPREPHRVVEVVGRRLVLVEHRQRRPHEVEHGRAEPPDLGPEARHREPLADRRGGAEHERRADGEHGRVDVEQRERAVEHVVAAEAEVLSTISSAWRTV